MNLSVITVCYNCEKALSRTLASVEQQLDQDFEYIIIDGKSTDRTVEIAWEYNSKIKKMTIISEEDMGIYDAMNKGVKLAGGDYVYFLNAGDCFYTDDVVLRIKKILTPQYDIVYGNIFANDKIVLQRPNITRRDLIYLERMICHQAIFAKRELLLNTPFDVKYKICADRDWLVKNLLLNKTFFYVKDMTIAVYDTTGVSSISPLFYNESIMISKEYGGYSAFFFVKIKRLFGIVLKKLKNITSNTFF